MMWTKKIRLGGLMMLMCITLTAQERSANVSIDSAGVIRVGVLGESGNMLVPLQFSSVVRDGDFFFVRLNDRWGCFAQGRLVIPLEYDAIGFRMGEGKTVKARKGEKWGFVNADNRVLIDFIYDEACNFNNGKAYVKKGNGYLHINMKGDIMDRKKDSSPFCPEDVTEAMSVEDQFEDGLLEKKEVNGKWGVVEKSSQKVIVPIAYSAIGAYNGNMIRVREGEKWGVYTDQGVKVSDPLFDKVGYFR